MNAEEFEKYREARKRSMVQYGSLAKLPKCIHSFRYSDHEVSEIFMNAMVKRLIKNSNK